MRTFNFILTAIFILSFSAITAGIGYQCCGLFQMDTRGAVVIEGGRPLNPGDYQAVRLRSCNTVRFAIQLWECSTNLNNCTLKWQQVITPIVSDAFVVNLDSTLTIQPSYKLGLYAPYSTDYTLPVPYGIDSSLAFLFEGVDTYSTFSQLQLQVTINLKPSTWTRSFAKSLLFCRNRDCSDVPSNSLAPVDPVADNPNQPPLGQCCRQNAMCDSTNTVKLVDANTALINTLRKNIDELETIIKTLTTGNTAPARCPTNFVPGDYGIGSCYMVIRDKFSFAEAALTCRDNAGSTLVQVNSKEESYFLGNLTSMNNEGAQIQTFWLAAMYQMPLRDWYWYDTNLETKYPLDYTRWLNGIKPVATNVGETCSSFVVDAVKNDVYWIKAQCNDRNSFVCEIPKECD